MTSPQAAQITGSIANQEGKEKNMYNRKARILIFGLFCYTKILD